MNFNVSPVSSPLPSVQEVSGNIQVNLTVTIPEAMLIAFAGGMIRSQLVSDCDLIYLGVSTNLQENFNKYVIDHWPNSGLTQEQLKLTTLVHSVWEKSKTCLLNKLSVLGEHSLAEEESQLHIVGQGKLEELRSQGISGGQIFTRRQAQLLTESEQ